MSSIYYLLLFLIFQEASNYRIRQRIRRNQPILTEFSRDTPLRNARRQANFNMFGQTRERVKKNFYQPYQHMGDYVFLRTTHAPTSPAATDSSIKQGRVTISVDDYNNAKMETYRGCNLVCPELFTRTGPVCGWYKRKRDDYFYRYAVAGSYWKGHHETFHYLEFDNICDLLRSNCKDLLVPGVTQPESVGKHIYDYGGTRFYSAGSNRYVRQTIRLAHLGPCITKSEYEALYNVSAPFIWLNYKVEPKNGRLQLEDETDKLMVSTKISDFLTRRTTFMRGGGPGAGGMSFIG